MKRRLTGLILGLAVLTAAIPARAEMQVLTIIEPPTNYIAADKLTGTSVDIVRELLRRMGLDDNIEVQPWARAYQTILTVPDVMLFTGGRTVERENLGLHFIGPVMSRTHVIYKLKGSPIHVKSLDDIRQQGLIVGGLRQDWRSKLVSDAGITVDLANTHDQSLKKLFANRFPLIISSDIEGPEWLKASGHPLDSLEVALVLMADAPSYLLLSNGSDPNLVKTVRDTFQAMQQTDFFEKTATKYSTILGYQLDYSPEQGFHRHVGE